MNHNSQPTSRITVAISSAVGSGVRCQSCKGPARPGHAQCDTCEARYTFTFRSLANVAAALPLLLCLIGAVAAQPTVPRTSKPCSFVHINGDAVISCPKAVR